MKFSPIRYLNLKELQALTPEERDAYYDYHRGLTRDLGIEGPGSIDVRQKDPEIVDKMSSKERVAYLMDLRFPPEKKLSREERRAKDKQRNDYQESQRRAIKQIQKDEYFKRNKNPLWMIHYVLIENWRVGRFFMGAFQLVAYLLTSFLLPKSIFDTCGLTRGLRRLKPMWLILHLEANEQHARNETYREAHYAKYGAYAYPPYPFQKNTPVLEPGTINPYQSKEDLDQISRYVHVFNDHFDRNAKFRKKPENSA